MTSETHLPATFDPKHFLKTAASSPGIYQMFGAKGEVLYVGKARNLQKRLASYFRKTGLTPKTASLVSQIQHVEVIVTHTENEALILESNLIKKFKPRYNILLRDDKGYPYIILTHHKDFPRLEFYRGLKKTGYRYFGPYPSSIAVRQTLNILQKLFKIRNCTDTFFNNRTRPCLQYQIKRCTAPCVQLIDIAGYQENVRHAILFLEGKNQTIIDDSVKKMEQASQQHDFEKAAHYRDQITYLRQVQQQQAVATKGGEADVFAVAMEHGMACVQILTIHAGRVLGSKAYFPVINEHSNESEILAAFLPQYYFNDEAGRRIPGQIVASHAIEDEAWIKQTLIEQAKHKVTFTNRPLGDRARWLQMTLNNAQNTLKIRLADRTTVGQRLQALRAILKLEKNPQRIECFDISHSHGEATVASCVVFDEQGPQKKEYRRFNITGITANDDYAAIHQALSRRFNPAKMVEGKTPDILIIDGGKGQLKQAEKVFAELGITGITLLSIAKGTTRKPGLETVYLSGQSIPLDLASDSLALHLLQQIRDEAHRFAITGHRQQRAKTRHQSVLQQIPGVGAKRRRELLQQFGGLQELKRSSVEELTKIPGISKALAERIYEALKNI